MWEPMVGSSHHPLQHSRGTSTFSKVSQIAFPFILLPSRAYLARPNRGSSTNNWHDKDPWMSPWDFCKAKACLYFCFPNWLGRPCSPQPAPSPRPLAPPSPHTRNRFHLKPPSYLTRSCRSKASPTCLVETLSVFDKVLNWQLG